MEWVGLLVEFEQKLYIRYEKVSVLYVVFFYGLGGVGKLQLVLDYVEKYKYDYNLIFWIDVMDEEIV